MIRCTCLIVGISPFSFSAPTQTPRNTGEDHWAHEQRIWRERIHRDKTGEAFISPMALKNCLSEVAKYLSESVPGKGKATYTKHFEAGITVIEPLKLGVQAEAIDGEKLYLPSDGVRGSGKRVWKIYPYLPEWQARAEILLLDPIIKPEKVQEYLTFAGQFIGLGRFRPRNNGFYGRFTVKDFKSEKVSPAALSA
jgi:hypothetical protein